jgi:sulfite reductase (NADPH) flavoprotein alpha-component
MRWASGIRTIRLVKELVELLWLKGDEPVTVDGKTLPLAEALQWHLN